MLKIENVGFIEKIFFIASSRNLLKAQGNEIVSTAQAFLKRKMYVCLDEILAVFHYFDQKYKNNFQLSHDYACSNGCLSCKVIYVSVYSIDVSLHWIFNKFLDVLRMSVK